MGNIVETFKEACTAFCDKCGFGELPPEAMKLCMMIPKEGVLVKHRGL